MTTLTHFILAPGVVEGIAALVLCGVFVKLCCGALSEEVEAAERAAKEKP